jgi:hypothetical protein
VSAVNVARDFFKQLDAEAAQAGETKKPAKKAAKKR